MKPPLKISRADLQSVLETSGTRVEYIIEHLDRFYRPKEVWSNGKLRPILAPRRELKLLQLRIARRLIIPIPLHPSAYCHIGKGALAAARLHAKHPWLLKVDLANFFPSVTADRVRTCLRSHGATGAVLRILSGLTTYCGSLIQGAPSSVAISNLVLKPLDERLAGLCQQRRGLSYTRYIDDVAISGGARVRNVEALVRRIVEDDGWRVNDRKSGLWGGNQRRAYLGMVINAEPNVDPSYVRDLRYLLHRLKRGATPLQEKQILRLRGKIDYVAAVNPAKGERLRQEFSDYLEHSLDSLATVDPPAPIPPAAPRLNELEALQTHSREASASGGGS